MEPVPPGAVVVRVPARGVVGARSTTSRCSRSPCSRARCACRRTSRTSGLVAGLSLFAAAVLGYHACAATAGRRSLRPLRNWALAGVAVARRALDPAGHRPVRAHTRQPVDVLGLLQAPHDATVGARDGLDLLLRQLDPWRLVTESLSADIQPGDVEGSLVAGSLLVVAWAAATFGAWRLRQRTVLAARRGARRRAAARHAVGGTHLRHPLLLPAAVGVGPHRADAVRDRLDRRRGRARGSERIGPDRARRTHADRTTWIAAGALGLALLARARFVRRQGRRRRRAGAAPEREPRRDRRADGRRPRAVGTGGDAGPVLPHVVPRRVDDRRGGLRPAQRAHAPRVRRQGAPRQPPGVDALPRDGSGRGDDRGPRRDRPRHRALAERPPVRAGDLRGSAARRGPGRVRTAPIARDRRSPTRRLRRRREARRREPLHRRHRSARVPQATRDRMARMLEIGLPTAVFIGPPSGGA